MPAELVQLGVAGGVAAILAYILKLVIDGKLHTDAEIEIRDREIKARDNQIDLLLKANTTLTAALEASNNQSRAILMLWKGFQSDGEGGYDGAS